MSELIEFFDKLLNESMGSIRYTQNSPVLPDVWLECARHPGRPHDLLLLPHSSSTPAFLAQQLREHLPRICKDRDPVLPMPPEYRAKGPRIAYNETSVVATLWFQEIVQVVLPLTEWWSSYLLAGDSAAVVQQFLTNEDAAANNFVETLHNAENQLPRVERNPEYGPVISQDLAWLVLITGSLATIERRSLEADAKGGITDEELLKGLKPAGRREGESKEDRDRRSRDRLRKIVDAIFPILRRVEVDPDTPVCLWQVNRNRETEASVHQSSRTVKADAVQRLFNVRGRGVRWAVIDSGIDATHIAFRQRDMEGHPLGPLDENGQVAPIKAFNKQGEPLPPRVADEPYWGAFVFKTPENPGKRRPGRAQPQAKWENQTRVIKTYDFTRMRDWLTAESVDELPEDLKTKYKNLVERTKSAEEELKFDQTDLSKALRMGRTIDWEFLALLLEVPHDENYEVPEHHHGTHVAGIMGADWRADEHGLTPPVDRVGVAPEVEFYDLRALGKNGCGDEFTILAAMQFVRNLNSRHNEMQIHGANLSFSILHKVASFACGRTPVCDEAERLVGNGVVVVAAAGNSGRARYLTNNNVVEEGYRAASITDPGNADAVITVGATHRVEQHKYGVSYFSSRGPTGDGRVKPDLVAPGEKISSTIPENGESKLDGTSMAAPHVSGAAALMLERNAELLGQPAKVKCLLCGSATDLGRERYYQGAGALDILRALQSV